MSPLAAAPPSIPTTVRVALRRVTDWWLEPVEHRHAPGHTPGSWQHSGGWGDHSDTYARW